MTASRTKEQRHRRATTTPFSARNGPPGRAIRTKCGAPSQTQARFCADCGTSLPTTTQPQGTVFAPVRAHGPDQRQPASVAQAHTMSSDAKALLVAGIALSPAIFGGGATLVSTAPDMANRTRTPRRLPPQPRLDHPPPRQPMPTPQRAAALPRSSRRSTARPLAGSCASRPPRETAAASAADSSWPRTWWPPSLTLSREP
jgi:hypothetical protein